MIGIAKIANYQNWITFIFYSLIIGMFLGFAINYWLCKIIPDAIFFLNEDKNGFLKIILINTILLSFGICRYSNEYLAKDVKCENYVILESGASGLKNTTYWVAIQNSGETERLHLGKNFYEKYQKNDTATLCKVCGLLGLYYFKEQTKCNNY